MIFATVAYRGKEPVTLLCDDPRVAAEAVGSEDLIMRVALSPVGLQTGPVEAVPPEDGKSAAAPLFGETLRALSAAAPAVAPPLGQSSAIAVAAPVDPALPGAGQPEPQADNPPLLSDTGSKIIDAYGIRNHEAKGRGDGVPHPVVYLLDQQGVIRVKLMRDGYRERPESAEIIAGAASIQ